MADNKVVLLPNRFTPRHMRQRFARKGGVKDQAKQKAFRRCKKVSDLYIHQGSAALEGNKDYIEYCRVCDNNALRKGK